MIETEIVAVEDALGFYKRMIHQYTNDLTELKAELQRRDLEAQVEQLGTDT